MTAWITWLTWFASCFLIESGYNPRINFSQLFICDLGSWYPLNLYSFFLVFFLLVGFIFSLLELNLKPLVSDLEAIHWRNSCLSRDVVVKWDKSWRIMSRERERRSKWEKGVGYIIPFLRRSCQRYSNEGRKYSFKLIANRNSPKHLLKLVFLSTKTLLEMTFPKGLKMEARSESPYSTVVVMKERKAQMSLVRLQEISCCSSRCCHGGIKDWKTHKREIVYLEGGKWRGLLHQVLLVALRSKRNPKTRNSLSVKEVWSEFLLGNRGKEHPEQNG